MGLDMPKICWGKCLWSTKEGRKEKTEGLQTLIMRWGWHRERKEAWEKSLGPQCTALVPLPGHLPATRPQREHRAESKAISAGACPSPLLPTAGSVKGRAEQCTYVAAAGDGMCFQGQDSCPHPWRDLCKIPFKWYFGQLGLCFFTCNSTWIFYITQGFNS